MLSDVVKGVVSSVVRSDVSANLTRFDSTLYTGNVTYSNDDLTVSRAAGGTSYPRATPVLGSGKFYFEFLNHPGGNALTFVGIGTTSTVENGSTGGERRGWLGTSINYNGGALDMGSNIGSGDVAQVVVDTVNRLFWFDKNDRGLWNNSATADPSAGTEGLDYSGILPIDEIVPMVGLGGNDVATGRFSADDITLTKPAGCDFPS